MFADHGPGDRAEQIEIPLVRHDHEYRAARADGVGGSLDETLRPRLPRHCLPDGPSRPGSPECVQELAAANVAAPAGRSDGGRQPVRFGRDGDRFPLNPGVAGRYR